ncbi:hypothetical protein NQZ68_024587 [Dissostichus eleginoides]|nr:hypothetical protein NQZ68_024587 [Dissostichus eleginoides]
MHTLMLLLSPPSGLSSELHPLSARLLTITSWFIFKRLPSGLRNKSKVTETPEEGELRGGETTPERSLYRL